MLAQVKSIKGITVLELLIVLMIIGVISSVAYPNFRDWRTTRQVQDDIQRAKSVFQAINAQVKRGQYAFVQVEIAVTANDITLTSKGMNTSTFSDLFNQSDWWERNIDLRCRTENILNGNPYWNDIGGVGNIVEVNQVVLEKTTTNLASGEPAIYAVCFSKTGKYYTPLDGADYLILCRRTNAFNTCVMNGWAEDLRGKANATTELAHSINWSRFGEVTVDKYRYQTATKTPAWVLQ